jgi:hypothetical protein
MAVVLSLQFLDTLVHVRALELDHENHVGHRITVGS